MDYHELSWRDRGRLWLRLLIRALLIIALFLFFFKAGPPLLSLFMPFVLALLLAWLLNPVVRTLQRRLRGSRKVFSLLLILILLALVGGILFVLAYNLFTELSLLAVSWQSSWQAILASGSKLTGQLSGLTDRLPQTVADSMQNFLDQFTSWFQSVLSGLAGRFAASAGTKAMGLPSFFVAVVVFVMGSYFLTADYPRLRHLASEQLSPPLYAFLAQIRKTAGVAFGGYVRAQFTLSIGVFIILLAGFLVTRQPYSVLLALLLAILDFIPILGSGTVLIPWAVVDLFTGDFRHAIMLTIIWSIVSLFRRLAEPKVLGQHTGLSPILSLVSIYVGMRLAGVLGMVLGPILCLIFINICRSGVFDGLLSDLRLATRDIAAFLHNRTLADDDRKQ